MLQKNNSSSFSSDLEYNESLKMNKHIQYNSK